MKEQKQTWVQTWTRDLPSDHDALVELGEEAHIELYLNMRPGSALDEVDVERVLYNPLTLRGRNVNVRLARAKAALERLADKGLIRRHSGGRTYSATEDRLKAAVAAVQPATPS